jgi:hypothetical protein
MKTCWMLGIVMAAGLPIHAEDCSVDVYVTTGVFQPNIMLMDPTSQVTAMFREIGVNVQVRMGHPARRIWGVCGAPIGIELDDSTGYRGNPNALAYAMPYKESGISIHIFLDRVIREKKDPAFMTELLAHVMVHEITHVLEKSMQHSEDGVMKAQWSRADHTRMRQHPLPFDPEDVVCIREGVAKRVTDAAASNLAPGNSPL